MICVIVDPVQIDWDKGVATTLTPGFTITLAVTGVPEQPFKLGVIVKVTVSDDAVVFVKLPVISPDPLAGMPVTDATLSLVQL